MEQKQLITSQPTLNLNSLTPHNIFLILSFLDTHTINAIIEADAKQNFKKCHLFSFARNQFFLQSYLNKTDRTIYMPFYSEPLFIQMEQQQLAHICSHSTPVLNFFSDSFKGLFSQLERYLGDFQMSTEVVESITESLTDPELPFPKLRKQNIGMHCNSAFQFFLVDKLFPSNEEEVLEETFEELNKYLSQSWNFSQQNQQRQLQTIEEVFSSWFKVSYQNYQTYLIEDNANHNLVVVIIALLDLLVDSISFYIQSIQDPLYSFIEFNMRYCIYRNIILSLEQKLGFLFKNYSLFCGQILDNKYDMRMQDQSSPEQAPRQRKREMTIWHCGLSKWYIYMQRHHQTYFKTFFYLLKKLNLQTIKQENIEKIKQDKIFIQLQNRLEFNEIDILAREETFEVYSPIQDIFEERRQLYSQVIKEYVEYIVDISINQYSVHWCGHSKQQLHIPYQQFENLLLEEFRQYFFNILQISKQVSNPLMAIDSTIKSIIQQLDRQYLKPITLKKIAQFTETELIQFIGGDKYEKSQLFQTLKELAFEFDNRDNVLNHFNTASNISNQGTEKFSIVIQSEDFNKALKTSASTAISRNSAILPLNLTLNSYDSILGEDL